jgi:hypothetical protein
MTQSSTTSAVETMTTAVSRPLRKAHTANAANGRKRNVEAIVDQVFSGATGAAADSNEGIQ